MNICIFCHHLKTWAGSEIVCLELLEAFTARGHDVKVRSVFPSPVFFHKATGNWRQLDPGYTTLDLAAFDLVIVLHQGLSGLEEDAFEALFAQSRRPFIAYFHLSPYEPFEQPGPFIERALADAVFANSEETRAQLARQGLQDVELFANPAPAAFAGQPKPEGPLRTLLSISNHRPPELSAALDMLRNDGVEVRCIGGPGLRRRVLPRDIAQSDAIVTIGKSVQYALRGRRPVFCYDHFQGPGWLTPWDKAEEDANFSGRSSRVRLSAEQITAQLLSGFSAASTWIRENDTSSMERFHLERAVDDLLARTAENATRRGWPDWVKRDDWRANFRIERNIHRLVDRTYSDATRSPGLTGPSLPGPAQPAANLTRKMLRSPGPGEAMVIAVFAYRYDAHLVPGLIENIEPAIHGYVALDDREAAQTLTSEADRQSVLYEAAAEMGAEWVFAVDPDERYEDRLADHMQELVTGFGPVVWTFECREMFDPTRFRADGLWGVRPRHRLFPCFPGMEPDAVRLHGLWTGNAHNLPVRPTGLDFYHMRMATPERRRLRRLLYCNADPDRALQDLGYDYLDDDRGQTLREVPPQRAFSPTFVEDHGIWAPGEAEMAGAGDRPDPILHQLRRLVRSRAMGGHTNAMHAGLDLMAQLPEDPELALWAADSAIRAGHPDIAVDICQPLATSMAEPLMAHLLLTRAYLDLGERQAAATTLGAIEPLCPATNIAEHERHRLAAPERKYSGPGALWRRWLPQGETSRVDVHEGPDVSAADISVVVMGLGAPAELADAVASLRAQSTTCEIVVVNSGGGDARGALRDHLDVIRMIDVSSRLYPGAVRNIGIDASAAQYVAFLASDCLATTGWLDGRLQAHRDGYAAVPCDVMPRETDSVESLAGWIFLHGTRHDSTSPVDRKNYGLSYDRTLFDQFGYFLPGLRIGEDTEFNARLNGQVEIARDCRIQLLHSYEDCPRKTLDNMRARARRRVQHPDYPNFETEDELRLRAFENQSDRLRLARQGLARMHTLSRDDRTALDAMLVTFAEAELDATLEAGQRILRARSIAAEVHDMLDSDPDGAFERIEQAMELWPDAPELLLLAARCAESSDDPACRDRAVPLAKAAFAVDPMNGAALSLVMSQLQKGKQVRKAAEFLLWAVTLRPDVFSILMACAVLGGPAFRPLRIMILQRAFFLQPWAQGPNRQLAGIYRNLGMQEASLAREAMLRALEKA